MQNTEELQDSPWDPETSDSTPKIPQETQRGLTLEFDQSVSTCGEATNAETARLLAAQATDPIARSERVMAIQAAIADGSYNVSAYDVATKLLLHMLKNQTADD